MRLTTANHSAFRGTPLSFETPKETSITLAMAQAQVRPEAPGVPVVRAEAIHKSFGELVVLDGIDP